MTTLTRIQQLEKQTATEPPKVEVNPYAGKSNSELLEWLKTILESGEPETPEEVKFVNLAKNILANNGIEWTVKL